MGEIEKQTFCNSCCMFQCFRKAMQIKTYSEQKSVHSGQVVGLGASGKAATRLALARGAERVTACDMRVDMKPLQVGCLH